MERFLFARIGYMQAYNGKMPGDEKPIAGGYYNAAQVGHEIYNFRRTKGRVYGFVQPPMNAAGIRLERIDPAAIKADRLSDVTVVWVAKRPSVGQVIIGWYRNAEVLRRRVRRSPERPAGFGHYITAPESHAVLLPEWKRVHAVPRGAGGMGQSNICYPLTARLTKKNERWIRRAEQFVRDYADVNALFAPESHVEEASAAAVEAAQVRSTGQGFIADVKQRLAIEARAMAVAEAHFVSEAYSVKNTSAGHPYDLECRKSGRVLYVEVKGTTTLGHSVVLTHNEVQHLKGRNGECAIALLHSVKWQGHRAAGGILKVIRKPSFSPAVLRPLSYIYKLSAQE